MSFKYSEPSAIDILISKKLGKNPMFTILRNWQSIIGDILFSVAVPVKLRNSVLTVGVITHPWMQELMMNRHIILKKIKEFTDGVKDIRFLIKTDRCDLKQTVNCALKPESPECEDLDNVLLDNEVMQFINESTDAIKDQDLRFVVHNVMCNSFARRVIRARAQTKKQQNHKL